MVSFDRTEHTGPAPDYASAVAAVTAHWQSYWSKGRNDRLQRQHGSPCRGARAPHRPSRNISRRSTAPATFPPQEGGSFLSNSWNGKFHLEVHPAAFGAFRAVAAPRTSREKPRLVSRGIFPKRRMKQRCVTSRGAWWPKMVGPEGRNSPSTINPFIMWQQPNPIYMAELVYRAHPDAATLAKYGALVGPNRTPARELADVERQERSLRSRAPGYSGAGSLRRAHDD